MKRSRFTETQVLAILKEADAGATLKEVCRRHGISDATFYTWKSKYGGMEVSDARRLKGLEAENAKLKRLDGLANQHSCVRRSHGFLCRRLQRLAWFRSSGIDE